MLGRIFIILLIILNYIKYKNKNKFFFRVIKCFLIKYILKYILVVSFFSTPSPSLQVCSANAQDGEVAGSWLWRALYALWGWQRQGCCHGNCRGVPVGETARGAPAHTGHPAAQPGSAPGSQEKNGERDSPRPGERKAPRGHRQNAAHLCSVHTGWHRLDWATQNL